MATASIFLGPEAGSAKSELVFFLMCFPERMAWRVDLLGNGWVLWCVFLAANPSVVLWALADLRRLEESGCGVHALQGRGGRFWELEGDMFFYCEGAKRVWRSNGCEFCGVEIGCWGSA